MSSQMTDKNAVSIPAVSITEVVPTPVIRLLQEELSVDVEVDSRLPMKEECVSLKM